MNAFKTYFLDVLTKNYIRFKGRATRTQYWMYILFYAIGAFILGFLSTMDNIIGILFTVFYFMYAFVMVLPTLSIGVRRLHDSNRSGWWLLIALVPAVGSLILFIFFLLPSTPGPNRFNEGN